MADQAPPGVNMPKKRDPRLRQMQTPQQQQFFDSADYEVRKQQQQQQQHQAHGQMPHCGIQRHAVIEGNARGACGGVPSAPPQQQQRQFQGQQQQPAQSNARASPNLQSPAF